MLKLILWCKMKRIFIICSLFIFVSNSFAKNQNDNDSYPEIVYKYKKLKKNHENMTLQVDFNKAVLLLEKEKYEEAISIFKRTAQINQIPSFLNIGIAYYKLNNTHNALLYLNKVYNYTDTKFTHTFSYMAASYYLYNISKDVKYLDGIIEIGKKNKKVSEHSKRMIADTYIILKEYSKAIKILNTMDSPLNLKIAMLYLKIKDYAKAELFLQRAFADTVNLAKKNKILWLMVFRDLKSNELEKLKDHLEKVIKKKNVFSAHFELPIKMFFNKNKYSTKEYLSSINKFSKDRMIDYIMYFSPFIFSDNEEVIYDSAKGFIFNSTQNLESLEEMLEYNINFLNVIKDDPILRIKKLKEFLKTDTKSYVYYNLALSYAQINDYYNAFKYFEKAYKLNPGNKLYAVMTLITADKIHLKVKDKEYLESNIKSKNGLFKYFGQSLYKMFINETFELKDNIKAYKKSIFYKSIKFLKKMNNNESLVDSDLVNDYYKDPFVYLIKFTRKRLNESDYSYRRRLQDNVPLKLNNNFLDGPLIITSFYIDILKSIGLFSRANFDIANKNTPSYLRTKALVYLHKNKAKETINILDSLQKKYGLEDKYTMYLIVAAYLELNEYSNASIQISLIKALLNDQDADFLSGVQLIQELKISSALLYFKGKYHDSFIDFKLDNFDKYLESL